MDKDGADSMFGASEEVHIEGQIWLYNVAGYLSYSGTVATYFYWTDAPQQVARQKKQQCKAHCQ